MPALPLDEARDPREVGPYRLLGRLGEGGQGVVYLAEAPGGRRVAVKMLKIEGLGPDAGGEARQRLAKEVEAAKRVDPFCTARVLDSSVEGQVPYVVSEYVPGPSLYERVEEQGPLDEDALIRLMIQSVSGLTAIHGAGIVHRDLKPSNLLLGPDGARVVDFGIARLAEARTHTGRLIGTPSYFSPEQLNDQPATMASDVFAWAGTMVFAATGRAPFGHADYGHEMPALFRRILDEEPGLQGVPERVLPLLRLCLDKDPERRPVAWSILEWLLKPPVPRAQAPLSPDPFTADAFKLLDKVPQSGPPIRLPPPGPPPLELPTVPPVEHDTVPPPGSEPALGDYGPALPAPPGVREPAPAGYDPGPPGVREPAPAGPPGVRDSGPPGHDPGAPGVREPVPAGHDPAVPGMRDPASPAGRESGHGPAQSGVREPADAGQEPVRPGGREPARGADGAVPPTGRRWAVPLAVTVALVSAGVGGWLALGPGGESGTRIPERFAGTWQGRVPESDGYRSSPADVTLSLPEGQESGTLAGSRCAGQVVLTSLDGDRMRLRLTSGPCVNGTVLATLDGGGLDYELRGGGSATGHGTLGRSGT